MSHEVRQHVPDQNNNTYVDRLLVFMRTTSDGKVPQKHDGAVIIIKWLRGNKSNIMCQLR